jgi:hypothetical protein
MRYLLMLAAAATLAACQSRSEDEVGAAPDRGDTTKATTGPWTGPGIPADTTGDTVSVLTDPGMSADTSVATDTSGIDVPLDTTRAEW